MKFKSLASSSHGNAYIVSDGETRILLECGIPLKKLQKAARFALSEIRACLVSHEHKDHAKSVLDLIERGIEVYMSEGTADALGVESVTLIESMEQFSVGTFDIVPFTTFHDAAEPLGFLVKSRIDGEVLAFATDTVNLRYRFPGVTILAIEANYDKDVLARSEKLPEKVRHRIANAHMEIGVLCGYLSELDLSTCREIYLLHLSDAMSREDEFVWRVAEIVPRGIKIIPCDK
ncbi:MAG: MBL fold metallo-hydrolase [Clostridia bacterium]|nr:MBL fold metallo-hydrolase [Clostridia bacterium]MBR2908361.1 MBL fold metallo-hydrolase [Clostridia bacterium]